MDIIEKELKAIHPYIHNPRKNDEAVEYVANSIKEFGFKVPIVIDKDDVIVAGHTRYKAAAKLGMKTVPCIVADDLTPEQVKAFRLADNKVAELAEWDFELLDDELNGLDFDMSEFGFEIQGEKTADDVEEDGYEPEPPVEPKAKPGDIYQLGEHRLMCGDSTSREDIEKLFDGQKPVFVFTDPPYGVAIGDKNKTLNEFSKGGRVQSNIEGDTLSPDDLHDILVQAFTILREHCSDECSYYVSSPQGGELGLMMMMMMQESGLNVRHMLIWVKNISTFSMGRLDYDYRHEPIFYTWTKKHNFYGDYSNTVIDDTKPIDKMSKTELKDYVRALTEQKPSSVVYCDKPVKSDLHPTMKPIKLVARFMVNSSRSGDICADIFGGSGTTLMAAEQLNRKCYMMEKDAAYVDVIIDRWETYTGEKAVLIEHGR